MLKNTLNKIMNAIGYELYPTSSHFVNIDEVFSNTNSFGVYSYKKEDGSFDYERYKKVQEDGNKKKIDNVWVLEENIEFLSSYLNKHLGTISHGVCHGTRRGVEQKWFKKYLKGDADVIGTEISETATDFEDTIQWDFHEVKPEWNEHFDFVYSNSFDHSYDPEKCINAWMSCVKKGGFGIIEHTDAHGIQTNRQMDPFGAHLLQMPLLLSRWGRGKFGVRDVLKAPVKNDSSKFAAFIVIEKY